MNSPGRNRIEVNIWAKKRKPHTYVNTRAHMHTQNQNNKTIQIQINKKKDLEICNLMINFTLTPLEI